MPQIREADEPAPRRSRRPARADQPVYAYVAAMSRELAQMAEWDGDPELAKALEVAAGLAERPLP